MLLTNSTSLVLSYVKPHSNNSGTQRALRAPRGHAKAGCLVGSGRRRRQKAARGGTLLGGAGWLVRGRRRPVALVVPSAGSSKLVDSKVNAVFAY